MATATSSSVIERMSHYLTVCEAHGIEPETVHIGRTGCDCIDVDEATFRRLFEGKDVTMRRSDRFDIYDGTLDDVPFRWWDPIPYEGTKQVKVTL